MKTRQQLWHHCMNSVMTGDACAEFGVWHGTSINWMANTRPDNAFHGFDSFEGLPEDWIRGHPKGHFKLDRSKLKFAPNVELHEGWFEDTLRDFHLESRLALLHIDCDLGSSTTTVLNALQEKITQDRPLILFDEFYNYPGYEDHEFKSWLDFTNRTGIKGGVIAHNANHQQALIQIL